MEEDGEKGWHSAFQRGGTHIWRPCVTGAAGLMMGFLKPAQLGQASPDSQRAAQREMLSTCRCTVCVFVGQRGELSYPARIWKRLDAGGRGCDGLCTSGS